MTSWADKIVTAADGTSTEVPGFPPPGVQERFVGRSGAAALEEVRPFVDLIDRYVDVNEGTVAIDFGAGWGRIARFFQDRIGDGNNFHLMDVDPEALEWCRTCRVVGNRQQIDPNGKLPLESGSVSLVYAYSVFSHLSERSAIHWLEEFKRAIKPDGILVFTTQSLRFLDLVRACSEVEAPNPIEERIGKYMNNPQEAVNQFREGNFVYSDTGGGGVLSGEFYGWAALPLDWMRAQFAGSFEIVEYIDDPAYFEQAVVVAKKIS